MAGTEFHTGKTKSVVYLWANNPPFSTKWKKTTTRTATKIVGLESEAEANSAMDALTAYTNMEGVQASMDPSGLWEVTGTFVNETWENMGNYLGGILQS